jgi:hypothetical protein
VRIFGGGDWALDGSHMDYVMAQVLAAFPNVRFYAISKAIRRNPILAKVMLRVRDNFHLLVSEARGWLFDTPEWDEILSHDRVKLAYTLMPNEDTAAAKYADVVFNVSRKRADIARYKADGLNLCPCDAGDMPHDLACIVCGKCYT